MEIQQFKTKLLDLFEQNRLKKVFSLLKAALSREGSAYLHFAPLARRFNDLLDQQMAHTLSREAENVEFNKISTSLLQFIQQLKATDFEQQYTSVHTEISNPIVIFTPQPAIAAVQSFFDQLQFSKAFVLPNTTTTWSQEQEPDVVVFDNRDLPQCFTQKTLTSLPSEDQQKIEQRIQQMELLLATTSKFLVHYGNHLYWINDHRDRVQSANSQFSLYARTKEVMEFINTYRI